MRTTVQSHLLKSLRIKQSPCAARQLSLHTSRTVAMAEPNRAAENGANASKVRYPQRW